MECGCWDVLILTLKYLLSIKEPLVDAGEYVDSQSKSEAFAVPPEAPFASLRKKYH